MPPFSVFISCARLPSMRVLFYLFFLLMPAVVQAAGLIRDAEIEQTLREFTSPIFQAAGLVPENIHLFIVNDPAINAFVAGGSNIFIHTGLLMEAEEPAMVIGVLAHETGHIAGGHLAQGAEQMEDAQIGIILGYILGAAAGLAGGGDAGVAVMTASQQLAQRQYLSFSRMNEQAADQAALNYLDTTHLSANGLLRMLEKLRIRETAFRGMLDPYALTHPLSKERISHIRGHLLKSDIPMDTLPKGYIEKYQRLRAKLIGFLQSPESALSQYSPRDDSIPARYARAIAYHRQQQLENAIKEVDSLLATYPKDPFFLELKGQILAESGKHQEALPYYLQASALLPASALLHTEYAATLLAVKPVDYTTAIKELVLSGTQDATNPLTWHLLAESYSATGQKGQAALAAAEEQMLANNPVEALRQVNIALKALPAASPSRLRAEDIRAEATKLYQKQDGAGKP